MTSPPLRLFPSSFRPNLRPLLAAPSLLLRRYGSSLPPAQLITDTDHLQARQWTDDFEKRGVAGIPGNVYEIGMVRSSGPGGQNVNKLSTKAVLRMPLPPPADPAGKVWLPGFVIPPLKTSPYYTSQPPSLLLTSSLSRSASQNRSSVLEKLHSLIVSSARSCIITPTSEEQKERVKGLMRREEGRRREMKGRRGEKKMGRSKGNWD